MRFTRPAPARPTSSLTWPTWRRIIGPRTGRVELLRAGRNVLEQLKWLTDTDKSGASRMERLLVTLVRTVPGALNGWRVQDSMRTRDAIERELSVLEEPDKDWRQEAVSRAESQLDQGELLWGARAPYVIRASEGGR